MSQQPFYSPTNPGAAPRQASPGDLLWTMTKAGHVYRAELRDRGSLGCELQILLDGDLRSGRLFHTRFIAAAEAGIAQRVLTEKGWTLVEPPI